MVESSLSHPALSVSTHERLLETDAKSFWGRGVSTHYKHQEAFVDLVLSIVAPELDRRASEHPTSAPSKDWMTEAELAEEWQCCADTIKKYAMRNEDPLPYGMIGGLRRYFRPDVNDWLKAEGERDRRRRAESKKGRSPLHVVNQ